MRITHLSITNLFDTFNYNIDWNDESQSILLLTGPNGFGKTTILNILHYLSEGQYYYFFRLPFQKIEVQYETGDSVKITKLNDWKNKEGSEEDGTLNRESSTRFALYKDKKLICRFDFTPNYAKQIEKQMSHHGITSYLESTLSARKTAREMLERLGERNNTYDFLEEKASDIGKYNMFVTATRTHFIPADRLHKKMGGNDSLSINSIKKDLEERIQNTHFEYLQKVSDSRDHMLERMITEEKIHSCTEYEEFLESQKDKILTLYSWGLLPFKELLPYKSNKDMVFSAYLDELKETLKTYDELYAQLKLFSTLIEKKNFVNKTVKYSPRHGLQVISNKTNASLDLDCLSSGEQNEILLLYDFIFNIGEHMLLLIDEPENSLHVAWQVQFYEELESICRTRHIQAIVATHSPQIIGNRWNKCFDLYAQNTEEQ